MNERIKMLAEQAGFEAFNGLGLAGRSELDETLQIHEYPVGELVNKLAELIVKDCLKIVDDATRGGSNETWDNAVKFIRRDLKEHFGVEE